MRHVSWLFLPLFALLLAAAPPPQSSNVQRQTGINIVTPPACNVKGTSGAPVTFTSSAEVIGSKPGRMGYWFMFEGTDARCEYGDTIDTAPATTPTTTVGMLYKNNILIYEHDSPQNSLWCACTSGTCTLDACEINP